MPRTSPKKKLSSQKRAVRVYRSRLKKRGLARFEVLGRDGDRELIRAIARRLAEDGPEATRLREVVAQKASSSPPAAKEHIVDVMLRWPRIGDELDLTRPWVEERKIDL